jgi:signal peptidase I
MIFFIKRNLRKKAEALLNGARLARNMREDVASKEDLDQLAKAEAAVKDAVSKIDEYALENATQAITEAARKIYPARPHAVVREWVELIVVALAVAMGFRTYLLQPFKIPTGSMQPSLYGIHYKPDRLPVVFRTFVPLRLIRLAITGEAPFEIRAANGGLIYGNPNTPEQAPDAEWAIGRTVYRIPKTLTRHAGPGETVIPGQLLASGVKVAGDHLFVNRLAWNFRRPRVGEVMVFSTADMDPTQITPDTHYIKRLAGRPGDQLRIDSPMLYVNGKPTDQVPHMKKVVTCQPGYKFGYQNGRSSPDVQYLKDADDVYAVPLKHYFGLGDNTMNSRDSRYFGPIPEEKLMGPALFVYWPLSIRWGFVD